MRRLAFGLLGLSRFAKTNLSSGRGSNARNAIRLAIVVGGTVGVMASTAVAEPPSIFSIFRQSSTTPANGDMQLKAENGPWLILAATLYGDDAEQKAETLANELRQNMRLKSYVWRKEFDYSKPVLGAGFDAQGQQKKMRHINNDYEVGYAVLVGDFESIDHPRVKETLETIKYAKVASLGGEIDITQAAANKEVDNNVLLASYRRFLWQKSTDEKKRAKGPMGGAFVTRNPLLPDDYFQPPQADDFVTKMNKDVEHSLLKNPGRFTVRIATFTGNTLTDVGAAGGNADIISDQLDQAIVQANRLTSALRKRNIEAYEYHDKFNSIVTVGSFDELGKQGADGQFQYHFGIQQIVNQFGGVRNFEQSQYGVAPVPNMFAGVPLDINPTPMAVPKPAAKLLYGGSLLGIGRK